MVYQCYCTVVCSGCTPKVYTSFCLIMQHRPDTLCLCVYSILDHMQFATHYCNSAQNVCFCVCIILGMYAYCVFVYCIHRVQPICILCMCCTICIYYTIVMCVYVTYHRCTTPRVCSSFCLILEHILYILIIVSVCV